MDGHKSAEGTFAIDIPPPMTSSSGITAPTERGDIHMSENVAYVTTTKGAPKVVTSETESSRVSVANVLYKGLPAEASAN